MQNGIRATHLLMRALDLLSDKWSLTDAEKMALLGLNDPREWQVLHGTPLVGSVARAVGSASARGLRNPMCPRRLSGALRTFGQASGARQLI